MRRFLAACAVPASLLIASAAVVASPASPPPPTGEAPSLRRTVLTADGPTYRYRLQDRRLVVRAARTPMEPNRRELLTRDVAPSRDQVTCATWVRQSSWRMQPGLAVRVTDAGGRVRAVTLTKNIVFGLQSVLNVVTWDTARRGDPWRAVAQWDLAAVLLRHGRLRPLPWRLCLRAQGRQVRVKVWLPGRTPEPSWDDPVAARSARLPRAFAAPGRPGWYVGHVPAGGYAVYGGLRTGS